MRNPVYANINAALIGMFLLLMILGGVVLWRVDVDYRSHMLAVPTSGAPAIVVPVDPGRGQADELVAVVATQQAEIERLSRALDALTYEQRTTTLDTRWLLDSKLLLASGVAAGLSLLGFKAFTSIEDKVREKIRAVIERQIYGVDPTLIDIYLVNWPAQPRPAPVVGEADGPDAAPKPRETSEQARERIAKRLRQVETRFAASGLSRVSLIGDMGAALDRNGIVVVPVATPDDEALFSARFLAEAGRLNPRELGVIVYAPDGYYVRSMDKLTDAFANFSLANTPTTLISAVLAVARGLESRRAASPVAPRSD